MRMCKKWMALGLAAMMAPFTHSLQRFWFTGIKGV